MKRCEADDKRLKKGTRIILTFPVSEMEKELIRKGNINFVFSRWAPSGHGNYACCLEGENGPGWMLHPESLIITGSELLPESVISAIDTCLNTKDFKRSAQEIISGLANAGMLKL